MHLRGRVQPPAPFDYKEAILNPATYIPLIVMWIIVFTMIYQQRREALIRKILNRKRNKEATRQMRLLVEKFIGKECLIYTYNSQITGTVLEVTDGAVLIDNGKDTEAVNMDYIVRVREYPRGKNGKKKSVVLD